MDQHQAEFRFLRPLLKCHAEANKALYEATQVAERMRTIEEELHKLQQRLQLGIYRPDPEQVGREHISGHHPAAPLGLLGRKEG